MNKKLVGFALAASLALPGVVAPTAAVAYDQAIIPPDSGVVVPVPNPAPPVQVGQAPGTLSTAELTAATAAEYLKKINVAIVDIQEAQAQDPKADWGREINRLISTATELTQIMESVAQHGANLADAELEIARAQLVIEIGSTIKKSTDNLRYKVQKAHVELGFAVTRAILRVVNIGAKVGQLQDSINDLRATYEMVSNYPSLTSNSRANLYIKNDLNKVIWQTRFNRDKYILGKKPYKVYRNLNRQITKAVGVWFRARATVQDCANAIENLNNAYKVALNS